MQDTPATSTGAARPLMPPLSCDCHVHVFGDSRDYPSREPFDGREQRSADITPMLVGLHRPLGIERVVFVQPPNYGTDHRCLLANMAIVSHLSKDGCRAVAIIDDRVSDRALHDLHEKGFRGARFYLTQHQPNSSIEALNRQFNRLRAIGWYAKVYISPSVLPALHPFLKTVGGLPIVIDQMGQFPASDDGSESYRLLCDLLQRDHVWTMLSGVWLRSVDQWEWSDMTTKGRRFLPIVRHRCIWGSDWPHSIGGLASYPPAQLVRLLYRCLPDEAARHAVLVTNPARLHSFVQ